MLNHIVLMGRLTRDPDLRYTQSQIPVASFRIAVDRDYGAPARRSRPILSTSSPGVRRASLSANTSTREA